MRASIVILALAGACPAVFAHHGFGSFVLTEEIEVTGTVSDFALVNPHSWLYLDVRTANGAIEPFRCEMRSATTLRRSGWSEELFPVGREVTITGLPDRNDPAACYVSSVVFDDGSAIDRYDQRIPAIPDESAPRELRLANGDPNIAGEWAGEQLVMSDPRGVQGSLVPLSQAQDLAQENALTTPGRDERVPLITGEAARRLFIGGVEMTTAGEAALAASRNETNPALLCEPISIVVDWSYDSPVNRITQSESTIILEYGKFDYTRTIHLDETAHPAELAPSLAGHSVGRWENDVLIVDTIGVRAGPLTRGLVNSDALHLTERYSLDPEAMTLTREFVAEDLLYYAEPFTGFDVVYSSNVPYQPSTCDDRSLF